MFQAPAVNEQLTLGSDTMQRATEDHLPHISVVTTTHHEGTIPRSHVQSR